MSIEERIQKHLSDHVGYTAKFKDWVLAWKKDFETKSEAYDFERKIKKWKSRRAIENLIKGT